MAKLRAAKDDTEREQIQADFDNLMYQGYIRNLKAIDDFETGVFDESNIGPRIMMEAADETYRAFAVKLGLIKPQVKKRDLSGMFTPPDLVLKYVKALRKNPGILDILKNALLAAPFLWGIINLKQDFLFRVASMVIGEGVLFLSLFLRGASLDSVRLPLLNFMEVPAMRTALRIHFFFVGTAFIATSALTRLFMMNFPFQTRLLTSMSSVLISAALAACLFEVFEPLDNKDWRFKQVLDEEHAQAQTDSLAEALAAHQPSAVAKEKTTQVYDFEYDPDEDAEEGVDLLEEEVPEEEVEDHYKTEDEMYADQANKEYEQFVRERKQERRAIMGLDEDAEGEEKLSDEERMGGKKGMFVDEEDVPEWLKKAFAAHASQAPWTRKRRVLPKDPYLSEVEIPGPKFFRDKTPKWMEPFILEPNVNVKDQVIKLKREYGAYRKAMHKKDKGVRLQPCDVDSYEDLKKLRGKKVPSPALKKKKKT